ncbi:MAG: peptidoglycan-binding domain-containing protein [Gammaproteobacteria bacterium]
MNTRKINAAVIALLSATALLSGCGDEQKETAKQTDQTISESTPVTPVPEAVDTATEMAGQSSEAVKNGAEQAVDKTAEAAQDLMSTTETVTTEAVITVQEAVSDANVVVKTTPELVRKIQKALLHAGFNPGPADGIIGPKTMAALETFQKKKNLATGQITKETLQALDIAN